MAIPNLEDWTDTLDEACRDYLAATIQYKTSVAGTFADLKAHVDYRDQAKVFGNTEVYPQDIMLSVLKSDVAAKPNGNCRCQLPRLSGVTLKPINVRSDDSGTHWEFEVQEVSDA